MSNEAPQVDGKDVQRIPNVLAALGNAIGELATLTGGLEKRLESVLEPRAQEPTKTCPSPPSAPGVGNTVDGFLTETKILYEQVRDILARLEL